MAPDNPIDNRGVSESGDAVVTILLIDPLRDETIHSWEFFGASLITIGRAATSDVVINDTLVSRLHGELRSIEGGWQIVPLGRNGILLEGRLLAGPTALRDGVRLQFGASGPFLEICRGRKRNASAPRLGAFVPGRGDEGRRAADTNKTDNDVLKSLQLEARKLKKDRPAPPPE